MAVVAAAANLVRIPTLHGLLLLLLLLPPPRPMP
jgi:hypothetical protein